MIYLDYSATTPLDPAVLKKMLPYFSNTFANPASIHTPGQNALKAVEDARHSIANILNCKATELIFTSGATEANNLALQGLCKAARNKGDKRNEIITTAIEHDSILEPLAQLEKWGYVIKKLPVNKSGLVDPEKLSKMLSEKTLLVSIGYVNSEVGVLQSITKFGRIIRKINESRSNNWQRLNPRKRGDKPRPIYFHTDATQAFMVASGDVSQLNVDLLSLSGHKIYGPKGIGLLFIKRDTPLEALQYGGHQERNLRSGTLNVPGIIGLAQALEITEKNRNIFNKRTARLRDRLVKKIMHSVPETILTTDRTVSSALNANFIFSGVEGDALLVALDELGVAVSTGTACASGDLDASPVLRAMGYSEEFARSAIRFSLGRQTTETEVDKTAALVLKALKRCRSKA